MKKEEDSKETRKQALPTSCALKGFFDWPERADTQRREFRFFSTDIVWF